VRKLAFLSVLIGLVTACAPSMRKINTAKSSTERCKTSLGDFKQQFGKAKPAGSVGNYRLFRWRKSEISGMIGSPKLTLLAAFDENDRVVYWNHNAEDDFVPAASDISACSD
jgi:hypothetical protein